jgi:uncharacterized membrane protein YoaK (UPF0700 family)
MDRARRSGRSCGGARATIITVSKTSIHRTKAGIALGLTFAAGMVDVIGYIAVYHMFVAHMTGDTVHLGHNLVIGNWDQAVKASTVIVTFVAGSIAGRSIIEGGTRRKMKSVATVSLTLEAILILIVVWAAPTGVGHHAENVGSISWVLALLAAAMGVQTATLTRIGPLTIHTTFVTGMLNKLAQEISRWLFWLHDEWGKRAGWREFVRRSGQYDSTRTAALMAGIWVCYALGSVLGTWMSRQWSTQSLYIPVGLLGIAVIVDQVRPLSLEEEKDEP